jgi:hypothetical protein
MTTIPFKFKFTRKGQQFCAEILEGDRVVYGCVIADPATKVEAESPPTHPDRHGLNSAVLKLFADAKPRMHKAGKGGFETFDQFKQSIIETRQAEAIDVASLTGNILAPENYVAEFWTAKHVRLLARALERPRKTSEIQLKDWLVTNWEKSDLCKLTRSQLCHQANTALSADYKPDKVWQTAYRRLGLFTDRRPGPPARS